MLFAFDMKWRRTRSRLDHILFGFPVAKRKSETMVNRKRAGVLIVCLPVVAMLAAAAWSQEVIDVRIQDKARRNRAPLEVFKGIENAWCNSRAQTLSRLTGESMVFVNVKGIGRKGGYFSRSQVYYLFKKMFKRYPQLNFKFVKYHNLDKPDRKVYGIARRSYKNIRSGRLYQDKVYVTLKRGEKGWVVSEIKTTL